MIRAILFDLDDTLYEERQFFRGGFVAAADALERRGIGARVSTVELLEHFHFEQGREDVFQKLATRLAFPIEWIPELVGAFRAHKPDIRLADDVGVTLPRLRERHKLGCVTDGWASVQRAKLESLGVEPLLDAVVVADDYGRDRWKPHPFPFQRCCELLGTTPAEAVFVGDNPHRDVLGARNAGLVAVRIRRPGGYFARGGSAVVEPEADFEVQDLLDVERLVTKL
jgi:putative hydrolase of the HAD superfamily